MKKFNFFRIPIAMLILILPLLAATPAYADAPVHEVVPLAFVDFYPADANPCGFDLYYRSSGQLNVITWYDEAGNPTRSIATYGQLHAIWDGGGKTLTAFVQGSIKTSYLSNTERILYIVGLSALTPVPGYGIAAGTVGYLTLRQELTNGTWETVEVSKWVGHDPWSEEARVAVCGYLAP